MLSQQIRTQFLNYFEQHGHLRVPSAPLIPRDDPSLLLVSAGMVPFKPYFLGQSVPPRDRLTSCQKAFRATDIDEVGDLSHDTFFEMLGNFSFGAYFKEEAIAYAFDLLTKGFGLNPDRLFPSVHPSDETSVKLWEKVAGIPDQRVARLEENFWQAGPTGPCGVDSEIYYDLGEAFGSLPDESPGHGERFLEIWNLVFMDSERLADGRTVPLPHPGVDTGMGLERTAMVLQGVGSIFDTDLFAPIAEDFAGRARNLATLPKAQSDRHLRSLADHSRAACMLIADGVLPSNEGRGYVLRRLMRRALVSSMTLEVEGGLGPAVPVVVSILGDTYAELASGARTVWAVIEQEEARFQATLARGMEHFEAAIRKAEGGAISPAEAFRLHDTYGFPVELTEDLASAQGVTIDRAAFDLLLEQQREISRPVERQLRAEISAQGRLSAEVDVMPVLTEFVGYDILEAQSPVARLIRDGQAVEEVGSGDQAEVLLLRSPFYAEGGGQVGDRGRLTWESGEASVLDTQISTSGERLHRCLVTQGELRVGDEIQATVDPQQRSGCAAHHSATHLLNAALHATLGQGVVQRGSLVTAERATFDFGWPRPVSPEELIEVERLVNRAVRDDLERRVELLSLDEARRSGALALPEETYGEQVRVVSFGDFSRELCGGTHVDRSGRIGAVVLLGEHSVGSGLRRIEMVVGVAAEHWWEDQRDQLAAVASQLRSPLSEVSTRVQGLQRRQRELERELKRARENGTGSGAEHEVREEVAGITLVIIDLPFELERAELRKRADQVLEGLTTGCVLVLAGSALVVKLSPDLAGRGLNAGQIATAACRDTGGGGGSEHLGQGGIAPDGHPAALATVRTILGSILEEA
ncbi:MAG: alanine--tRNA ligase [Candidatus Dormiibacterota bacterium]